MWSISEMLDVFLKSLTFEFDTISAALKNINILETVKVDTVSLSKKN